MDLKIDNPDSRNHKRYQAAVNRIFVFFVCILYLSFSTYSIGVLQTVLSFVGVVLGLLCVFAVLYILGWFIFDVLPSFYEWLSGY